VRGLVDNVLYTLLDCAVGNFPSNPKGRYRQSKFDPTPSIGKILVSIIISKKLSLSFEFQSFTMVRKAFVFTSLAAATPENVIAVALTTTRSDACSFQQHSFPSRPFFSPSLLSPRLSHLPDRPSVLALPLACSARHTESMTKSFGI
jgi:hypothetical protein